MQEPVAADALRGSLTSATSANRGGGGGGGAGALSNVSTRPEPRVDSSTTIKEVVVGTQKRPGFDLVRIGNFAEDVSAPMQDIAFFHHRLSVEKFQAYRLSVLRFSIFVLRDICSSVFKYPTELVTLFYEEGSTSRFIKQKIMINIAPIEKHLMSHSASIETINGFIVSQSSSRDNNINNNRNNTSRNTSQSSSSSSSSSSIAARLFPYTYLYGLLVHKLAHFFDVVHGTRHEFFMDEYRALVMYDWVGLLRDRGFDPETVVTSGHSEVVKHLWDVVL